jgi:hypothetical protein
VNKVDLELPEASSTLVQLGEEQAAIEADLLQACTTVRVLATQVEAAAGSPAPQATSEVRFSCLRSCICLLLAGCLAVMCDP